MGGMRESRYRWYLRLRGTLGVSAPRLNRGRVATLMMTGGGSSVQDGAMGTKAQELRFLMWRL
jgi:hypothetical protein